MSRLRKCSQSIPLDVGAPASFQDRLISSHAVILTRESQSARKKSHCFDSSVHQSGLGPCSASLLTMSRKLFGTAQKAISIHTFHFSPPSWLMGLFNLFSAGKPDHRTNFDFPVCSVVSLSPVSERVSIL